LGAGVAQGGVAAAFAVAWCRAANAAFAVWHAAVASEPSPVAGFTPAGGHGSTGGAAAGRSMAGTTLVLSGVAPLRVAAALTRFAIGRTGLEQQREHYHRS
jgi:hypothetical protein